MVLPHLAAIDDLAHVTTAALLTHGLAILYGHFGLKTTPQQLASAAFLFYIFCLFNDSQKLIQKGSRVSISSITLLQQ